MTNGKKWHQKLWAKYVAIVVSFGLLGAGLTFVVKGVNWFNNHEEKIEQIDNLQKKDSIQKLQIEVLLKWKEKKSSRGYAVGYRVKWITDEITGKRRKIKQYRDWSGHAHNITIDRKLSDHYAREYYFYTDEYDSVHYCP